MKKIFQYMNQLSIFPKIFNQNFTTPSTVIKFYRSTSCSYIRKTNICTNCQKFENQKPYVQKSIKKQEVVNLIPDKTKAQKHQQSI